MTEPAPGPTAGQHDHKACVSNALAMASALCQRRGVRLTPLRQRVLELVWRSHVPVGAYEILDRLRVEDGRSAAPPTVYRALEFLMEQKLIHRIESLNAFVGCIDPSRPHAAQYLICRQCGTVTELDDGAVAAAIQEQARRQGFSIDRQSVEVHGTCGHCADPAGAATNHAETATA
ncbi:MAG: transcriptional repressor [Alphaproteobacteria bacterium]|nr:transcriptional repressor [Alphaproteobacteria bacterium]